MSKEKPSEPDLRTRRNREFFWVSLASAFAGLIGIVFDLVSSINVVKQVLPALSKVHWTFWVCAASALYTILAYLNELSRSEQRLSSGIIRVPPWSQLRAFGDKRVSRIFYWALVIIPISAYFVSANPFELPALTTITLPLSFKLAFFASWCFSIALLVFTAGCPREFRLEDPLERARTINVVLNEVNDARISFEKTELLENPDLDRSARELRAVSFLFYVLGLTLAVIILFRSAWYVLNV